MSSNVESSSVVPRAGFKTGLWQSAFVLLSLVVLAALVPGAGAQPVNDNFANATVITGVLGSTTGNTTGSTIEPGEPFHYCSFFSCYRLHSVWYRWTAPVSGSVTFDTSGTYSTNFNFFDTIMAAYSGTNVAALTRLASNDDYLFLDSLITFPVVAGTVYHIAVDGYAGASNSFVLNWTQGSVTNALVSTNQIAFFNSSYSVDENFPGFATITVVAGGGFDNDVTVDYFTADGTAVVGTDYNSTSNRLTFSPGEMVKSFTIEILDNAIQNSNKTVLLTLANPLGGAVLGSISNATLTIRDDETPPFVSAAGQLNILVTNTFFAGSGSVGTNFLGQNPAALVTENETFESFLGYVSTVNERSVKGAVVTVTRTAPAVGRILVDYYTTNTSFNFFFGTNIFGTNIFGTNIFGTNFPSALAGSDYQPVSGTLVFEDYQMMANIVVPVYRSSSTTTTTNVFPTPLFFDVVLANPRPDPAEDPSMIVPTIGMGQGSVEIFKINNYRGFSIERRTYRADEYDSFSRGGTNVVSATNAHFVDIDIILPGGGGGGVAVDVEVNVYGYFLLPGSDYADPFRLDLDNTLYTDGTTNIINFPDYGPLMDRPGLGGHVTAVRNGGTTATIPFPNANTTRRTVRIVIPNDKFVEFNEDIGIFLSAIPGTPVTTIGNGFANAVILFDDQPAGAADREWNPEGVLYTIPRFNDTPGANNSVSSVVIQPDDKTIIGGDFDHYNSSSRNHLARLNTDGSLDATFNPGTGADGPVNAVVLYPTNGANAGRILIGGGFTSYNGTSRSGIARVNPNGSLDGTFAPGNGADGTVRAVALQSDGKIIVAGEFTSFNGLNVNGIMRVNTNGTLDLTFNPGAGANAAIWSVTLDETTTNRLIYVAGDLTLFDNQTRNHLARLTDSGSLDATFDPGLGADGSIYAVALQPDGKLLVGGAFGVYHTSLRNALARVNADGTLDENYNIGSGADDSIYSIVLQPDGKAVIGGVFTTFNNTRRMGLARIFISGSLDTSFMDTAYNQFAGLPKTFSFDNPSFVNSIALQSDGNIMIGGSFTNLGGNLSVHYATTNQSTVPATNFFILPYSYEPINGRTNKHNSGAHVFAPFTRQDKTTRFNVARVIGGYTPGPGNLEYDPDSLPFTANENNGTLTVTLRRVDGRLGTAETVPFSTNNTAVFPFDFSTAISTQVWSEWSATVNAVAQRPFSPRSVGFVGVGYFAVPLSDDVFQEGDETFGLRLTNAFGSITLGGEYIPLGASLGHLDGSIGTIADNDFNHGIFNFQFAGYTVNENAGTATISVSRTNGSSGTVTVDYRTRNGTATSGADYTLSSGTLRFVTGQTNATFTVPIFNGPEVEFDETVTLVLTNATGGAKLPGGLANSTVTATLTIIDDDFLPGRLQFSVANYTNNENDVTALVTVTRTGGNLGALTAQFQTLSGGTATLGADYAGTNGTLIWADGDSAPKTFQIPLVSDGLVEGPESVLLRLSNPSQTGALGARTNATLWINDGDFYGALSFNQGFYETDENGSHPTITVVRSGGSAGTISVMFATSPLTAAPGVDYYDTNGTLTFLPGEFSKTFQVPIIDNTVPDGDRTLQISLFNAVNAGAGLFTNVILMIVDNESINLPAGSLDTTFSPLAAANAAVYAAVQQLDGRLIVAGDFTQVSSVPRNRLARLKPSGLLDNTFDIGPGANDSIRALALSSEGKLLIGGLFTSINGTNRSRVARLSTDGTVDISFNPGAGADNPVFALTVQPNDKVLVGGSFNTFNNVTRPGLVRLNTNGIVDASFNVGAGFNGSVYAIALQNNGKILVGGEFISFNGAPRTNFVRLNANGTLDGTFNPALAVGAPVRAILVEDDARIVIGGSFTNVNGSARKFMARLDVNGGLDPSFLAAPASPGADNTVYVIRKQVDGRLVVGGDFKLFNNVTRHGITRLYDEDGATDPTINFGDGANAFVAALVIQPDRRIVLGGGFTEYDGQPRAHIARIYGGSMAGSGALEFSAPQFLVGESSTNAAITVRRRGGTTGAASVDAFTSNGSAVAGVDYLSASSTLNFPPGETRQVLNVPILPNTLLNGDRTVQLGLANFVNAVAGPQPFSTLLIQDDESSIGFASADFAINENAVSGNATITLVRLGATNTTASVDITSLAGGTATAFVDYIPTNATVLFAPGETIRFFNLNLINDTNMEGNESILLALSNPSGTTSLGITNAVLNLIDDDLGPGQFIFSTNNYVVFESVGTATITVLRTNGSTGIASVLLTTSNGTATAFLDYIPTNRVLTFADGETTKTLDLPIINDLNGEANETVLLTLANATGGASLGSPASAVVNILDNDTPIIIGSGTALVAESLLPTNSVIEPGETVTLLFALRNSGFADAANVTAGLVYANGVSNTTAQTQNYGNLPALGNATSRPFTFTALGTNGSRITATLLVTNGGQFLGPVAYEFVIGQQNLQLDNTNLITINDNGPASPYPSTIVISGAVNPINRLTVTLRGLTHSYPGDLDILLVAPNGAAVMLMSDAGSNNVMNNVTLSFSNGAPVTIPNASPITNGTYRATNWLTYVDPIPPFPNGTVWTNSSLATFQGLVPNGVWSLYIVDDSSGDNGLVAGGWSLNIFTADKVAAGPDLALTVTDAPDPVSLGGSVTYRIAITNFGLSAASSVVLTNLLPTTATFISVVADTGTFTLNGNTLLGNLGSLAVGAGTVVTVTMTAPVTASLLSFDSTVSSAGADLNTANNHVLVTTSVVDPGPVPLIAGALQGNQVVLKWAGNASNVTLVSSASTSGGWTTVTNVPVFSNGVSTVTLPADGSIKFFRLRRVP